MKELTLEEMKNKYKALGEEIAKKEKAEAEEREARLVAEKAARREEVKLAEKNYKELLTAYVKDYGSYCSTESNDDSISNLFRMFF